MRHVAEKLRALGWQVMLPHVERNGTSGSLVSEFRRLAHEMRPERIVLTEPVEWRLRNDMQTWSKVLGVPTGVQIAGWSLYLLSGRLLRVDSRP